MPPTSAEDLIARLNAFPWQTWNQKLAESYGQAYADFVVSRGARLAKGAGVEFDLEDPFLSKFMTSYVGERITQLSETSKKDVTRIIRNTFDRGDDLTTKELGAQVLAGVREKFRGYQQWRADRIARTESGIAYNHGTALLAYQNGMQVDVIDGDDDEECAAANGAVWTAEEALANPIGHPNCTRAFTPHVDDGTHRDGEADE